MKIIILLLACISSYSSELLHYYPKIEGGKHLVSTSLISLYSERAYDLSDETIDSISTDGGILGVQYLKALSDNLSFSIELEYMFIGEYEEEFSGDLSHIPNKSAGSDGVREPKASLTYWFDHNLDKRFHHALNLSYRPKILTPDANHYAAGRNELQGNYIYSFRMNHFDISGSLFTHIYGKKEIKLPGGIEDKIGSYSEAGLTLSPGYLFESWALYLVGGYSSTTDYNTNNSLYERKSDKGFSYLLGLNLRYASSANTIVEFSFNTKETVFNSIEEDVTRDIEYEIEDRKMTLKLWYEL